MPAYNASDYIGNAICSVQSQTFTDYELIIVENCSTDSGKTIEKIKEFSDITLIQSPINLGCGGRNEGLKIASGQYILFLDSDDAFYDNYVLENLNSVIEKNDFPDLIYMGFTMVGTRELTVLPTPENCNRDYRLATN